MLHTSVPLINFVYNGTESILIFMIQNLECTLQQDKVDENSGTI